MPIEQINTLPIAAPRYSDLPFPPYRFIPGRHPHPVASPQGHSYRPPGEVEPPVHYYPPEEWSQSPEYLYGCDLYNHAYWWEAHEAWEGLWRVTPEGSPQRRFLQGMIQVGATHLQLFLRSEGGVTRLRMTSMEHLHWVRQQISTPQFMGLGLTEFMARVDEYYATVLSKLPSQHDPAIYPYIQLA